MIAPPPPVSHSIQRGNWKTGSTSSTSSESSCYPKDASWLVFSELPHQSDATKSTSPVPSLRCLPPPSPRLRIRGYILAHFHRRVRVGSVRLGGVVRVQLSYGSRFRRRQYPYGRAGFKPEGDSRGIMIS